MAHLQIFAVIIAGLAITQAFVVPQNDGTQIRDQILNQKFSFLDSLFKNSAVDVEAIKAKIKSEDPSPIKGPNIEPTQVDNNAIRNDILNNKFAFLENRLKQFNVDVSGIKDRVSASMAQKHAMAKRAVPENGPVDGLTIRDQALEQKFAFLENLLKQYNVDFNAIKERIKASTGQHSIAKRAVPEGGAVDGVAIRDQVLEEKFAFLENLLKQYNVNFSAIKERIKASTEQHSIAKRAVAEGGAAPEPVDGIAIRDQVLNQKFEYLSNLLGGLVDFNAIKERIKASTEQHSIAKRAVTEGGAAPEPLDGIAKRDQVLNEKFEYLSNLLGGLVDFNAIKERIKASTGAHSVSKREVPSTETPALGGDFINGLTGAINAALKSLADALLVNINASTNGIFQGTDILVNLQALLYGLIDRSFPTTTTSYTSLLSFGV